MLELTLKHDGRNWVAYGKTVRTSARTLNGLDRKIRGSVLLGGRLRKGRNLLVHMAFDSSCIPQWIRQYAQHYFNRVVTIRG